MHGLLEQHWRDVSASGLTGALAPFQIGIFSDHVLPEFILPPCQFFLVSNDFFGAELLVLCQRDKTKVHMGRFLVYMHHGGYDRVFLLMFFA